MQNINEILIKAERFCAYQERNSYEVKKKLHELQVDDETTTTVIASLKENDFLNDERYAKLFVSGKFRIKKWGKIKIRAELRMKKISENLITKALCFIEDDTYQKTIQELIKKKESQLSGREIKDKKEKVFRFLVSKGFESGLVLKKLNTKS